MAGRCSACGQFFASEGNLTRHIRKHCSITLRRSREQWKHGIFNVAKLNHTRSQRHEQNTFRSDSRVENVEPVDCPPHTAMVRISFVAPRKFLGFLYRMLCLRTSMQLAPLIHLLIHLPTHFPRSVFDGRPGKYGRACKMTFPKGQACSTHRIIQLPATLDLRHQTLDRFHHSTLHRLSSKLVLLQTDLQLYGSTNGTLRRYPIP